MNIIDAFYKEFPNIQIRIRKQNVLNENCVVDIFDSNDGHYIIVRTAHSFEEALIGCFEGMADLRRGLSEKEIDDMKQRFKVSTKEQ